MRLPGDQTLPATGRAPDAKTERIHFQAGQQLRKPSRSTHVGALLRVDMGVDVGNEVECLAEEGPDRLAPIVRDVGPGTENRLNSPRQPVPRAGVDDTDHVERGGVDFHDAMVGAVDQVVEAEPPARAVLPLELLSDLVDGAADLIVDVLVAVLVLLHETVVGLDEGAVLLLDEQHVAASVDGDEIHLAEVRPFLVLA